ncbi:hypothetical protein PR202_gb01794 [Eleusine coracana subsp. coracana]|uniref:Uncharacterized protein n=1 Tax=Eleusine coracana subsp. coracana TaxID=191504 RepID=A0AAV5DWT6_ELECO|nr:hypothetical protein PR202_gb01794 [Eleusine coracana subsp. coracana]
MGAADANSERVNLGAPLISVRRHVGPGPDEAAALPSYKPGETSSRPVGHAGAVPFRWEHRPGHPKSVRTRRPPTTVAKVEPATSPAARAETEEQCSADARSHDDVSCVTVNCSATGLSVSDAAATSSAAPTATRGSGAMMDRFLPAAHAVAVASPLTTFRKAGPVVRDPERPAPPPRAAERDRLSPTPMQRRPPPQQHVPAANQLRLVPLRDKLEEYDDDDAESDVHSTRGFASRRCGLLPTRCVKNTLLLLNPAPAMRRSRSRGGSRREEGERGRRSQREMNPLLRRSRSGQHQQQPPRHATGHGPGGTQLSWEELYVKSLLRSARGSLMGPAAAVASELDKTVRELYRRRGGGEIVQPKASHLGLLFVLDKSNDLLAHDGENTGGYGFPLLLEDKAAAPTGREIVLSPRAMLPFPLPKSPSESWLSRALPSVSSRPPPATSFLGLHVQSKKNNAPALPWCSIDPANVVDHARQRQIRVHDLQK